MTNRVTLLGTVVSDPVYHCTVDARDLLRLTLHIPGGYSDMTLYQECVIWGGPALGLADCLRKGDRIFVRGSLRYRRDHRRPYVHIRQYVLLGSVAGEALALSDAHEHAQQ